MSTTSNTEALKARAERVLAGGVLHHLTAIPGHRPEVFLRGKGSRLWNSDGKEFIDYYLGSASLVLGHAHPEVTDAVRQQLENGTHFFEITPAAIELAELVVDAVPSAERLKYAMSGTEAVTAAVRVARAHTKKTRILKFEGAYHGSHDWLLWGYRHRHGINYPFAQPDSPGIPRELQSMVLIAPYNHPEAFKALVEQYKDELAAVLVEPLLGNVKPKPGFLEMVRGATKEHGIPLIFDEVVTGFRLSYGGAQKHYGVVPDMTALGKSLGGGHPIGALVGRADLMEAFSPARVADGTAVLHVGTYSGNPVSCTAGAATLKVLKRPGTYERLHATAQRLGDGLREISARHGLPTFVVNEGPMVDIWFTDKAINAYPDTWSADGQFAKRFRLGLMERGIWAPPGLKMFLSLAHSDEDVARTLEAADASMRDLKSRT
jgi:glutamate-1-semialdehyde 2,1-aminomutase